MKEKLKIIVSSLITIILLYEIIFLLPLFFKDDIKKYFFKFEDTFYMEYREYIDENNFLQNSIDYSFTEDYEKKQDDEKNHYIYKEFNLNGEISFEVNWDKDKVQISSYKVNELYEIFVWNEGTHFGDDTYWNENQTIVGWNTKSASIASYWETGISNLKVSKWYNMPIKDLTLGHVETIYNNIHEDIPIKISFNQEEKKVYFHHLDETVQIIKHSSTFYYIQLTLIIFFILICIYIFIILLQNKIIKSNKNIK